MKMNNDMRIKVAEEINKHFSGGDFFTEKDVKKLKRINKFTSAGHEHHNIYAVQTGDLTVLGWIKSDGRVRVKGQAW